jgi:uncharacterized protein
MKNELSQETSPYLLQHAHNPVHWQAWNEKTLQLAKDLDKPILVSIGYAACHWCHVMEKESFENEATAALMNEYFINIKIDREERPDIDHIYMDAVQAIAGNGGWPLNVFLTPDAKPFYGGTYFPPVPAHGRSSWPDVLTTIHTNWTSKREALEMQADNLLEHLKKSNNFSQINNTIQVKTTESNFTKEEAEDIAKSILANADTTNGGFGKAPKFPQTFSINCLLQSALFFKNDAALTHAELCLTKMYEGGIYDQLAGGLCRYSTDEIWLAPHFEKMLYDNALFIIACSNAYLFTKKEMYKNAINDTCTFLINEMKSPTGGYYAAIDADSEGVEGKFYTWSKSEIENVLGADAALFCTYYNVIEEGNWEHTNILHISNNIKNVGTAFGLDEGSVLEKIHACKTKLLTQRNTRIRPATDDKILLGWNALLIKAFAKAYAATLQDNYLHEAESLFLFVQESFSTTENQFYHTYKNGEAKIPAFLDDYAYLIESAIHLQEISSNQEYLFFAKKLTKFVLENFSEESGNFFYFTPQNQADIIMRKVDLYDGATPSANGIMMKNLAYLGKVFAIEDWSQKSIQMIVSLKTVILKHPNSFGVWAAELLNSYANTYEIIIVGTYKTMQLQKVLHEYIPNKIIQSANEDFNMPLVTKKYVFNKTLLYLCLNSTCKHPYEEAESLVRDIKMQVF